MPVPEVNPAYASAALCLVAVGVVQWRRKVASQATSGERLADLS